MIGLLTAWHAAEKVRVDAASWIFGVHRLDGALYFLAFVVSESKAPSSRRTPNEFFSSLLALPTAGA